MANRFLASFAPFLSARLDDEYVYNLVRESFTRFLQRNVAQYPAAPVWFVGSVAEYFRRPLTDALEREGMTLGGVVRSPIEGLVKYHSANAGFLRNGCSLRDRR